jgi:hypothetical protein
MPAIEPGTVDWNGTWDQTFCSLAVDGYLLHFTARMPDFESSATSPAGLLDSSSFVSYSLNVAIVLLLVRQSNHSGPARGLLSQTLTIRTRKTLGGTGSFPVSEDGNGCPEYRFIHQE